jgi:hypothetical protein
MNIGLRAKFFAAGFALMALVLAWPVSTHNRAKGKIEAYRRELKAKGEKLEIAELVPTHSVNDFSNSASLLRVASHLRTHSPSPSNLPPVMKLVAPGKALVSWQQSVLPNYAPTEQCSNVWPGLSLELANNREVIDQIRPALRGPVLAFDLDYAQGPAVPLDHLPSLKGIAQWLSAAAIFDLHEGHGDHAWTNMVALNALSKNYRGEPVLISDLVRISIAAIAANTAWEALQTTNADDNLLGNIQSSWEGMDFLAEAEAVVAMDRALGRIGFAHARDSYDGFSAGGWSMGGSTNSRLSELRQLGEDTLEDPKEGIKNLLRRYPKYWYWSYWQSYEDELVSAEVSQACLDAFRQARKDGALGPSFKKFGQDLAHIAKENPNVGNWSGGSPADVLPSFVRRLTSLEIQRSLLVTAIALKRYQLKPGTYPAELSALKPEFLREVPRDPMDGKPLRYRLNPDGSFLLYSVGDDGVDDGGNTTPSPDNPRNWTKARDAVWPQPATAEEVKADLEKLKRQR